MSTSSFQARWCGHRELDGRPIYLPILSEADLRELAGNAGLVLLDSSGVRVKCPGSRLHIQPNAADGCVITDEFGLPRLVCQNSGCRDLCHKSDFAMRSLYVEVLQNAESRNAPTISHEALHALHLSCGRNPLLAHPVW